MILLKAINKLKEKYNIFLTIIGERVDEETVEQIYEFIRENDLQDIIEIKFNLSYKQVLVMYKDHDLFVLPSYNEPAAYSLVEAMSNKLPIICSDTCGTKCYVKEGANGYIFKSQDSDNLSKQIEKVILNRVRLKRMGESSFILAEKEHFMEIFEKKISKLIK